MPNRVMQFKYLILLDLNGLTCIQTYMIMNFVMNHTFQSSISDLVHENIGDKNPILSAQQTFGGLYTTPDVILQNCVSHL